MFFLNLAQLLVDFGLVVLIWMVQLIIYPSFLHYESHSLNKWHKIYTGKITVIVAPLMIGQLGINAYLLIFRNTFTILEIIALSLIAINWVVTLFIFIPLHEQINLTSKDVDIQIKLVQYNWVRVILFCLIFLINVIYILSISDLLF